MVTTSPYTNSEFALSNTDSLSSWKRTTTQIVEVSISNFTYPNRLKGAFVHFTPFTNDAIFEAVVLKILKNNMASVSVKVPHPLRHISLQHGEIYHPFIDNLPPRKWFFAKLRIKWLHVAHHLPRSFRPTTHSIKRQLPSPNDKYDREMVTWREALL
jgi:hypothetical protein